MTKETIHNREGGNSLNDNNNNHDQVYKDEIELQDRSQHLDPNVVNHEIDIDLQCPGHLLKPVDTSSSPSSTSSSSSSTHHHNNTITDSNSNNKNNLKSIGAEPVGSDSNGDQTNSRVGIWFRNYINKMKGTKVDSPFPSIDELLFSWLGAFLGIGVLAALHYHVLSNEEMLMLVGSFGASAVLVFSAIKSPLAQPRNLVGGHILSAIVGVILRLIFVETGASIVVGATLAVSLSIVVMMITKTVHPPGGATALIAVMSPAQRWAGFYFVLVPIASGSLIMLLVALLVNNLSPNRKYPVNWY